MAVDDIHIPFIVWSSDQKMANVLESNGLSCILCIGMRYPTGRVFMMSLIKFSQVPNIVFALHLLEAKSAIQTSDTCFVTGVKGIIGQRHAITAATQTKYTK